MEGDTYDVIVIGAGLSGMAAALRLGMFGKKTLLLEKHYVVGGLNSFYARKGRKFDVGLHALTNFPSEHSKKKSPLLKLCRQLRIPYESLELEPQSHSKIVFGDSTLKFDNDFSYFIEQIQRNFPDSINQFLSFLKLMEEFPAYSVDAPSISTRKILSESKMNPLLSEMLLCPTCYYGSAQSNDIDFPTFIMLFDAIFRQGLARPRKGIRSILDPLCKKLSEFNVERRMNEGVKKLHIKDDKINKIELESGEFIESKQIISTCGLLETETMLTTKNQLTDDSAVGKFSVIESISILRGMPADYNWDETIIFFNDSEKFMYDCPQNLVDMRSGVICLPENYGSKEKVDDFKLRITHPANFDLWQKLDENLYHKEKQKYEETIFSNALKYLNKKQDSKIDPRQQVIFRDTFTPRTIKQFTSHENGTLYGSPTKTRDGSTRYKNLFLAGTDQGYVGIVGALLGGIAIANNKILKPS